MNRAILTILVVTSAAVMGPAGLRAQTPSDESISVEDATFVVLRDSVIITYDLVGPADLFYDVDVTLRKESDSTFAFHPRALKGGVGRVKGAGQKIVIWSYKEDGADTLGYAGDYWFEVSAVSVEKGFEFAWWHAALVGGGAAAAAILLSNGGGTDSPASADLPDPPGIRPPR